jgi:CHASE3 domain sensor protein
MVLPPPEAKKPANAKTEPLKPVTADAKPADKPKSTYENAATERKRIIQEEIDLEKTRLSAVQARIKDLAAQSNKTPDQVKDLVALQQKEILHTSNLQLLQKELNK